MADNTLLNSGAGGDTIRDLARLAGSIKTQVIQLDIGGASANAEVLVTAGQQVAALSLPVVIASNQSALSTANVLGSSNWAQSLAVAAGSTPTVLSIASTIAGYQVKGLLCHGTGDGYFFVQVNGLTIVSGRTRATAPMLQLLLPNGIGIATGSALTVKVTNESGTTADYEITLLGN